MAPTKSTELAETPLVNEVRLNARQWAVAVGLISLVMLLTPVVWPRLERFETGPDYRIPYELSKDYWLYQRRLRQESVPTKVFVLGDSVIWGEYVRPEGTLPHFLSKEAGRPDQFVNAGVNGLFPLALEGLIRYYGADIHGRKVLLHCNLLWLSSPKADLQIRKEEKFNHARLVPQFTPRIPCYKADTADRLGVVIEREVGFLAWVNHLQNSYFGQKSILEWTLADDGGDPPAYPNSYKNPLAQITSRVPSAPPDDPLRGPQSARHRPWSSSGSDPAQFEWVDQPSSLQWAAFQRLVMLLRERNNDVLVVLGPFNEHIIAASGKPRYEKLRDGAAAWLAQNSIACLVPEVLPSELYADASHPLTEGYERLARQLFQDERFQKWLKK